MRILLATDAWAPQVNGVVVTLRNTVACLERWGHEVRLITPEGFRTVPMPTYPEIPLALLPGRKVSAVFREFDPEAVHIATEGPLGLAARGYCVRHGLQFTTAYHTCFPEYVRARFGLPLSWTYAFLRWLHRPSAAVMVATPAIHRLLREHGFSNLADWSRGVDTTLFRPGVRDTHLPRPVFAYVGRVAVEKNMAAFLSLELPGTKLVVGDGPQRRELEQRFPRAVFVGAKSGEELAAHYRMADVMVFPSLTDTFGLVLIESMACGTPVAAFPVRGPIDVVTEPGVGILDTDLRRAALTALRLDRAAVSRYAQRYSWDHCTRQFLNHLTPARRSGPGSALVAGQAG